MPMYKAGTIWNVNVKEQFTGIIIRHRDTNNYLSSNLIEAIWTNNWNGSRCLMLETLILRWKEKASTAELSILETKMTFYTRELRREITRLESEPNNTNPFDSPTIQKELKAQGW